MMIAGLEFGDEGTDSRRRHQIREQRQARREIRECVPESDPFAALGRRAPPWANYSCSRARDDCIGSRLGHNRDRATELSAPRSGWADAATPSGQGPALHRRHLTMEAQGGLLLFFLVAVPSADSANLAFFMGTSRFRRASDAITRGTDYETSCCFGSCGEMYRKTVLFRDPQAFREGRYCCQGTACWGHGAGRGPSRFVADHQRLPVRFGRDISSLGETAGIQEFNGTLGVAEHCVKEITKRARETLSRPRHETIDPTNRAFDSPA